MPRYDVAVVGAGFTGLAAAFELTSAGKSVVVIDSADCVGGLAASFQFSDGVTVERFYHHWFTSDTYVTDLVAKLGFSDDVLTLPSRTGMYLNGRIWSLSSPIDLLRFTALPLTDRLRLGLAPLRVRRIHDWTELEPASIREWLEPLCGTRAYKVVWEPLVRAKFGRYADDVTAVWMWKKLVLRGSTRDGKGSEQLSYFKGGFGRLCALLGEQVVRNGGTLRLGENVTGCHSQGDRLTALVTSHGLVEADSFLFTPAPSQVAEIAAATGPPEWLEKLRRVNYLANMCLILRLDRSLSETYWLNVNDPGFPFVGVIEHTNFDAPEHYGGNRIAYLSRYLATDEPEWSMTDEEYLEYCLAHLTRMFPHFQSSWIKDFRVWRARFAQPVTERNYSKYEPGVSTPWINATLANMSNIYPEDRGTNYAIRDGIAAARRLIER